MPARTPQTLFLFFILSAVLGSALLADAQSSGGIFVTPIPNAPFSGTVRVELTILQPDGSTLQMWSLRQIARDSAGRIRNEFRPFVPVTAGTVPQAIVIHIYDPQNRMTEYLYPAHKTYRMIMLSRPPATDTLDNFASPTGAAAPSSDLTRQDDLGYKTIAGLQVHGVRVTQIMTPAESGTGHEITVTNEYWYSEALRVNLSMTHSDPRTGSETTTVTEISREEPDAGLFGVPLDYTMAGMADSGN